MTGNGTPVVVATERTVRRYTIDVRLFLATVTTAMALAFGMGVAFGPGGTPMQEPNAGEWRLLEQRHVHLELPQEKLDVNISDPHHPAGQHLLVDIKNVDSDFLNSEERLAKAMVDAVQAGGLTMLSYHCHALVPAGVSCVGVLLESHISLHTWPSEGVITLDLFTCGPTPLLPILPTIKELFGIGENAVTQWGHELRGFRSEDEFHYLDNQSDLTFWVLSPLDIHKKELVVSVKSPIQQIDIWDVLEVDDTPSHEDALRHNLQPGDPRWFTPEVTTPDRLLFLDGTLQSLSNSEHVYHEALVHPAMFAHPKPAHVIIVGGGEGATLREVLKHNTIQKATMIDIDPMLIEISRQYLPGFSDCKDLEGRADNCFDDELATIVYEDGIQWFVDRFGPDPTKEAPSEPIDVVIVDALDPEDSGIISDKLYSDSNFLSSLVASLSDEGVLVIQVGTAPTINDPRADVGIYKNREALFNVLESFSDVAAMFVYEEAHCGYNEPHSFLVVCKSVHCRSRWYAESDAVDFEIYERIVRTKSKKISLEHFDGSTERSYQIPPKAWETVYCRREPTPFECAYLSLDPTKELHDIDIENEEASSFRLDHTVDENDIVSTSVFATVNIPKGSYIMPEHLASSFIVSDKSVTNLISNTEVVGTGKVSVIEGLLKFIDRHGHKSSMDGVGVNYVEVGATYMIRRTDDPDEANVGRWMPPHPSGSRPTYSPVYERHRLSFDLFIVATKDIVKGDELLKYEAMWE